MFRDSPFGGISSFAIGLIDSDLGFLALYQVEAMHDTVELQIRLWLSSKAPSIPILKGSMKSRLIRIAMRSTRPSLTSLFKRRLRRYERRHALKRSQSSNKSKRLWVMNFDIHGNLGV